ncbi:ribonuclease PH [Spirochaetota bacterium]
MRTLHIQTQYVPNAFSSVLYSTGNTTVLCAATITDTLPAWVRPEEHGWLTAEYSMLPAATLYRKNRNRLKVDFRNVEIERFIARSLRGGIDLKKIRGKQIIIDCDVLNADGSTRTASVSGGYIALSLLVKKAIKEEILKVNPLISMIAAVSVGKSKKGKIITDLNYREDATAIVDMNVVMNDKGNYIEVQGTAENGDFSNEDLQVILGRANEDILFIFKKQKEAIDSA